MKVINFYTFVAMNALIKRYFIYVGLVLWLTKAFRHPTLTFGVLFFRFLAPGKDGITQDA